MAQVISALGTVADGAAVSWIVTGYLLPLSALLLAGGAAGDRNGRRRLLMLGVGFFMLASLLCVGPPISIG
jgi:MFS family permease